MIIKVRKELSFVLDSLSTNLKASLFVKQMATAAPIVALLDVGPRYAVRVELLKVTSIKGVV